LSYREVPRRPHAVSPRVFSVLRPLYRYSDWREAWILRGVGERYGPVLRLAPGPDSELGAPPEAKPRAWRDAKLRVQRPELRIALREHVAPMAASLIILAGVIGFVSARSTAGGHPAPPTLARSVAAGLLEVSFPTGWLLRPAPAALGLIDGRIATSKGQTIAVGRAATTDPSLLPASILALFSAAPRAQLVTLRGATFYRYLNFPLRGSRTSESIYVVPTVAGTVVAVCRTPKFDRSFASMCQRVVASLRLGSGTLAPGLLPAYASGLSAAIVQLTAARATWGARLGTARTRRAQARAANALASAHEQAAAAVAALSAGPATAANSALVAALRMDADAYRLLAGAAAHRHVRAYRRAAAATARADAAMNAALAQLRTLGYAVT
jgi:hypothetical protein